MTSDAQRSLRAAVRLSMAPHLAQEDLPEESDRLGLGVQCTWEACCVWREHWQSRVLKR